MSQLRSRDVAREVLEKIDLLFPKFDMPSEPKRLQAVVNAWAYALGKYVYPDNIWLEAVDEFYSRSDSWGAAPLPGDILDCARVVMERAERDPVRGPKVRAWREARQDERDRLIREQRSRREAAK